MSLQQRYNQQKVLVVLKTVYLLYFCQLCFSTYEYFYLAGDEGDGAKKAAEPQAAAKPEAAAAAKPEAADGFPPTFTEKPRIVPNETGSLVTMKFKVIRN